MLRITVLLLSALVMFSAQGFASAKRGFYSASVQVTSQSAKERRRAASEGLKQVILRVTGSEEALYSESLFDSIDKALSYVEQFQYSSDRIQDPVTGESKVIESLNFKFSPRVVKKILHEAELRFWPINRPKVLVWLVEDNIELGKQLINQDIDFALTSVLDTAAWQRGLTLNYPLLDLDDNIALPAEKAWAMDVAAIKQATQRYDVDVILVGRLTKTSRGDIRSTWQYINQKYSKVYDVEFANVVNGFDVAFGRQVVDPLATHLADMYSIIPNANHETGLMMLVSGVESYGAYRGLLDYLEGLAAIQQVRIDQVSPHALLLDLETDTDVAQLENAIHLGKKLTKASGEGDQSMPAWQQPEVGTPENPLSYIWSN